MSVAASSIFSRVRTQLIDNGVSGPVRWTDAELLQWLSDGQRTIVAASPRASAKRAVVPLVAGTRQTIPADGYCLLTPYRNMTSLAGTTPGNALQKIERNWMDTQFPAWHMATPVTQPTGVMWDPSDPGVYYVTPPSDGTGYVEMSYAVEPPEMTATTDLLVVKDIYATPLFDYVMFRCADKDSDYAPGQAVAAAYSAAFTGFIASLMKDDMTLATQANKT